MFDKIEFQEINFSLIISIRLIYILLITLYNFFLKRIAFYIYIKSSCYNISN